MNLDRIIKNCDRVIKELPSYAAEIIEEEKKEVLSIQEEQIKSGYRGDGKRTKKYKSDAYVKRKKQTSKSKPYRDYFDTGEFLGSMFLNANGDNVFIGSYDEKTAFLEKEEDNEMFGIMPSNQSKVDKRITPKLIKKVGNELGK